MPVLLSDIEKAETLLVAAGRSQVRVLIYPGPEIMQKAIRVKMKVFSKKDLG
jgi:hypothetical protein